MADFIHYSLVFSAILSEETVLEIGLDFILFKSQNVRRKQMPSETVSTAGHHASLILAMRTVTQREEW